MTARHVRLEVVSTWAASSDNTRYKRLRIDEAWIGSAFSWVGRAHIMFMFRFRRWRVCVIVAVSAPSFVLAPAPARAATFDVRDYGAAGNGSTNDSDAINAANADGGGTVLSTPGTYLSAETIHMRSNVTIQLDSDTAWLPSRRESR